MCYWKQMEMFAQSMRHAPTLSVAVFGSLEISLVQL